MKCVVCNKEFTGSVCPRCTFPNVYVPVASQEKARRQMSEEITRHRREFLKCIRVELVCHYWKDSNGWIVLDHTENVHLGTGSELYNQEFWLDQPFARIADCSAVPVRLRVTIINKTQEYEVSIPNLPTPSTQQLGITLDSDFRLHLKLRNGIDPTSCAEPIIL